MASKSLAAAAAPQLMTKAEWKGWLVEARQLFNEGRAGKIPAQGMARWVALDAQAVTHMCAWLGCPRPKVTLHVMSHGPSPKSNGWASKNAISLATYSNGQVKNMLHPISNFFEEVIYERLHVLGHELGHVLCWNLPSPMKLPPRHLGTAAQDFLNRHLLPDPQLHGSASLFSEIFADATAECVAHGFPAFPLSATFTTDMVNHFVRGDAATELGVKEGIPKTLVAGNLADGVSWGEGYETRPVLVRAHRARAQLPRLSPAARLDWIKVNASAAWRQRVSPLTCVAPKKYMGNWRAADLLVWAGERKAPQAVQLELAGLIAMV